FNHPGFSSSISDSAQVTIGTDNELTLQILSIAFDETQNTVVVGEDITGDISYTSLIATVRDTNNEPISGQAVVFIATSSNTEVGSITYLNQISNTDGQVVAYFDDGGNIYKDTPGTPNYEGVTVIAQLGDKITSPEKFNVYSSDDVWPYNLFVTTNTDVIQLDGGVSTATITARLLNRLGNPVTDGQINYIASRGFISATGFTDITGVDSVTFTDLGNPEDVGVSDISATFSHPGFSNTFIQDSLQVYIEDPSFQECTYISIPSSVPGSIVVANGGGTESTTIKAELYDDNDNLINTPTLVRFKLHPILTGCYLEEPGVTDTTVYTVNGVASVSVNSGTRPGPIRVEVSSDCDQDGTPEIESVAVPVIIEAGPPHYIFAEWDPVNGTVPSGAGFYKTQVGAMVYDRYYNPVEDSTYVYWSIEQECENDLQSEVYGTSFTYNEPWQSDGDTTHGLAFSTLVYPGDEVGETVSVVAYTWGDDINGDGVYGDSIGAIIENNNGDVGLIFVPGIVMLTSSVSYYDFTLNPDPAIITITATVLDFYGNPMMDVPISFEGVGVTEYIEFGYEEYTDEGVLSYDELSTLGNDDGFFTWRDYGHDDNPITPCWGNLNDIHDASDTTGDGIWDISEVSEPFDDFGLDAVENTFDEGEGDGEWDGYPMIDGEPIVFTDNNGNARITFSYSKGLCTLANVDEDTGICTWDDFTSSITATLMISQITSSDPMDIVLVRTPDTCD
ncbi:MAG: Ig-like domain-containing protein, partial [Candidatus Marinimicrobia bacterium]|nr:Ig-like domain-containing protein [Candidatus Neomarinimicrobiota bacterium]